MEIHQLRYFVAVAEEGSFSNAAEREHVSQPSLSQQIHKLEAELNQQLFDRLPRSVVLTEAGRDLLHYARQILSSIADARQAMAEHEHEVAGKLSVGAIPSIAVYVLPRLIQRFQQRYPKVTFELFEDTTDKLAQRLEDGTLDIALATAGDETPTLARYSLGKESLVMLLPQKHRLARKNHQMERARLGEISAAARSTFAFDPGPAVTSGEQFEARGRPPGRSACNHRADGRGWTGSNGRTPNDGRNRVHQQLCGCAFCQARADARADLASQSSAVREQSCRSIP